ncbi:MAG: LysR family transcriptional regulator [Rhodospirillales bacterium]
MTKVKPKKPRIRILLGDAVSLGPGKIELIDAIEKTGSISSAAKSMNMSYRRAWNLVDSINHDFTDQIVVTSSGGKGGGGAVVTDMGLKIIERYRQIETKALKGVMQDLEEFGHYLSLKSSNSE